MEEEGEECKIVLALGLGIKYKPKPRENRKPFFGGEGRQEGGRCPANNGKWASHEDKEGGWMEGK